MDVSFRLHQLMSVSIHNLPHIASLCFVYFICFYPHLPIWHLCFEVSHVLSPENILSVVSSPSAVLCILCSSLFICVNHIRLHRATCPRHLVLMVTAVVMRGEMREWWMVIVVLLWARNITLPSRDVQGFFEFTQRCQCIAVLRPVVMKTNSRGWVFFSVCWSAGISCSILI